MITGNLEYVMCSLPYLSFRDAVEERHKVYSLFSKYANKPDNEMNLVAILDDEAEKFLRSGQFRLFKSIRLENIHLEIFQKSDLDVIADFSNYVFQQKKGVEQLRVGRRNGTDTGSSSDQILAINPGNPLEEEVHLLKLQWNYLEDISSGQYDNFGALIIYKLKLLLLIRWWGFDQKQGFENFLKIIKED
ncbi:DUF2764 family protein [Aureitalea sp. L0-47]|uniref:DUF2764 family protein n=1 Tax=Aureitalea sp. L0-47 TaxID=2816962 RepID=UPI002238ACDA|nr:DUF2764 family protein [Aureitalea sp. L0-47]MCW5518253.1 DUF2764 family protein [Aureitalea sp. L0-47]